MSSSARSSTRASDSSSGAASSSPTASKGCRPSCTGSTTWSAGLQRDRAEQHGQLLSGLEETVRQSQTVAATTQSLREALSSSRARGQWGERMADDVLRLAGFVEGVNYAPADAARRHHPGLHVPPARRLGAPHGRQVPDGQLPAPPERLERGGATAPRAPSSCATSGERVRSLNGRGYVEPGATVDFVLLFIPNEATYGFVHEQDIALADEALRQRVVLCSPFTLFAVLAVVRQAVDSFALQRSTDEILELLTRFSAQWDKFTDAVDTLGRRLDSTGRAFEDLAGPRRRQLQRLVDRVDDLRRHDRHDEAGGRGADPGGRPARPCAGGRRLDGRCGHRADAASTPRRRPCRSGARRWRRTAMSGPSPVA